MHLSPGLGHRSSQPQPLDKKQKTSSCRLAFTYYLLTNHLKQHEIRIEDTTIICLVMGPLEIDTPLPAGGGSSPNASSSSLGSSSTSTTTRQSRPACKTIFYICILFLICILSISRFSLEIDTNTHQKGIIRAKLDNEFQSLPIRPQMELFESRQVYFKLPEKTTPKGIFIYLHSCKQSGLEFFHLPEDRIIAYDALKRDLAVVAPTSQNRESGCWGQADLAWVGKSINEWAQKHNLSQLPRIGMAESSAGSFLFFAHDKFDLKSMAVYHTPQGFDKEDIQKDLTIPTAFVTMPADEPIYKRMEQNYEALKEADVATQLFKVAPHPYTERVCRDRMPEAKDHCRKFFRLVRKEHSSLMDVDGFIKEDLKTGKWKPLFDQLHLGDERSRAAVNAFFTPQTQTGKSWLQAGVEQEISACQAYHSMTSESHAAVLDFLVKEARIGKQPVKVSAGADEEEEGRQQRR